MNNDPYFSTYPTLEAAVSALCETTFGATLHLETQPTPEPQYRPLLEGEEILITDEWLDSKAGWNPRAHVEPGEKLDLASNGGYHTPHRRRVDAAAPPTPEQCKEALRERDEAVAEVKAWLAACRRKDDDIDKILADKDTLDEETKRLHALWHEAVADAQAQREEVKRLTTRLDNCQSGNRSHVAKAERLDKDLFSYGQFTRNVATALGMSTHEISFNEVISKIENVKADLASHKAISAGVMETLKKVDAERDRLKGALAKVAEALPNCLDKTTPA